MLGAWGEAVKLRPSGKGGDRRTSPNRRVFSVRVELVVGVGISEFAPAETPTAGQGARQGQAVASRASLNQERSSRLADEYWGIAMREAHALQRGRMSREYRSQGARDLLISLGKALKSIQ